MEKKTYGEVLSGLAGRRCPVDGFYGDAVSELAIVWINNGRINDICDHPNAVKKAVRNKARDLWRAHHYHCRAEFAEEDTMQPCSTPEDNAAARRHMLRLKAALSCIHFEVISLDAQGCTDNEIGAQVGVSAGAARALLKRARIRLREAA